MALKLVDKVVYFLKENENKKYMASQIAEWVFHT